MEKRKLNTHKFTAGIFFFVFFLSNLQSVLILKNRMYFHMLTANYTKQLKFSLFIINYFKKKKLKNMTNNNNQNNLPPVSIR